MTLIDQVEFYPDLGKTLILLLSAEDHPTRVGYFHLAEDDEVSIRESRGAECLLIIEKLNKI